MGWRMPLPASLKAESVRRSPSGRRSEPPSRQRSRSLKEGLEKELVSNLKDQVALLQKERTKLHEQFALPSPPALAFGGRRAPALLKDDVVIPPSALHKATNSSLRSVSQRSTERRGIEEHHRLHLSTRQSDGSEIKRLRAEEEVRRLEVQLHETRRSLTCMQRDSSDLAKKYNDLRDQRDREMSALRSRVAASEAEANKLADALNTNLSKEREWARERDVLNQQLKRSKEEAQSYHDRDRERGRDGRASPGLVAGRDRREEDRREIEALRAEVRRATTRAEAAEAESRQLAAAVRQKAAGDGAAGAAGGYHSQGTSPPPARGWAGVMSPRSHHDGTSDRELSDLKAELRRASDREAAHRDKLRSVEKTLEAEREYFKEETARCHATIVELRQKVIQAEQRASDAEVDASAKVNELKAKTSGLEAEAERAKGDILGLRQKEAEAKRRQQTVLKQAEKLALEVSSWAQDGNTTADRSAAELAKWLGQAVVAHGALSPRKALRLRAQLLENRIEDPPEPTTPPPSRVNRPLPFSRPAESVSRRTVIQSIVT